MLEQTVTRRQMSPKAIGVLAVIAIIVIALIIILVNCISTVKPGYVGVVYNANGGLEQNTLNQGWHVVAPWKHVTQYPISTETVYLSASSQEGTAADNSVNAGTSDGKPINLDVSYTFHFDPTKIKHLFTKFRGQSDTAISDTFIRRAVKNDLNAVSTQYGIFDIYGSKRQEVATNVYKMISKELEADGILIESFNITDVRPDAQTAQAIQAKVNAEQALVQAKLVKEKADIDAQTAVVEATGKANAVKVAADAEAYANKVKQLSITPDLIKYIIASRWDGKQPLVVSGNGQILDVSSILSK